MIFKSCEHLKRNPCYQQVVSGLLDDVEEQVVPVSRVYSDLRQPRKVFVPKDIAELADSILATGLLKAPLVEEISRWKRRKNSDLDYQLKRFNELIGDDFHNYTGLRRELGHEPVYQIIFGDRRFHAHWMSGLTQMRARVVRNVTPEQRLAWQLEEASQERVAPYEIAPNIVDLHTMMTSIMRRETGDEDAVFPLSALAVRIGRSPGDVCKAFQYCALIPDIQQAVREGFPYAVAVEIGRVNNPKLQEQLYLHARRGDLNAAKMRAIVSAQTRFDQVLADDRLVHLSQMRQNIPSEDFQDEYPAVKELAVGELGTLVREQYRRLIVQRRAPQIFTSDFRAHTLAETRNMSDHERSIYLSRTTSGVVARARKQAANAFDSNGFMMFQDTDGLDNARYAPIRAEIYALLNALNHDVSAVAEMGVLEPRLLASIDEASVDLLQEGLARLLEVVPRIDLPEVSERQYGRRIKSRAQGYDPAIVPQHAIKHIPLDKLRNNPDNVRRTYHQGSLDLLSQNIVTNGQLEELHVVSNGNGNYVVLAGNRRLKAMEQAEIDRARCIVLDDLSAEQRVMLQIVEDSQKPFKPVEMANSQFELYRMVNAKRVHDNLEPFTLPQFAREHGFNVRTVRERFSYLTLPDHVQRLVARNILSYGSAVEISYLPMRWTGVARTFDYDPRSDEFKTADQIFSPDHEHTDDQLALAL